MTKRILTYHLFFFLICWIGKLIVMSELLFESYQVPSVTYGIDSLFSLYANGPERVKDGIVMSAGHHYSHVIPVSGGKVYLEHAKR